MLKGKKLYDFATLVLKIGVNIQKDQGLEIICPVEKAEVAETFAKCAYDLGAKIVHVRWEDEKINKINYMGASIDTLCDVPDWIAENRKYLLEKGFCYVAIASDDPAAYKGVPENKLSAYNTAYSKKLKFFSDSVMNNAIRWCVVSVPTKNWAKKVFPKSKKPEAKLSLAIEKTMRLDTENPLQAWERHIEELKKRADFLNSKNFEYLHYTSKNGTDLMLGLAENHVWISAEEKAQDGVKFVANMPTEEVFTAPHKDKINGIVKSCLPLSYNGQIIDGFSFTFKDGKVVDFSAKKGYKVLKNLLATDGGTMSLGEVALIGKNSPIATSGILFYNTLFDENASCHLALGKGYPTTVKGGDKMTDEEFQNHGVNDSIEHVDFMVGAKDLSIDGIGFDGAKTPIFRDGEWVI